MKPDNFDRRPNRSTRSRTIRKKGALHTKALRLYVASENQCPDVEKNEVKIIAMNIDDCLNSKSFEIHNSKFELNEWFTC